MFSKLKCCGHLGKVVVSKLLVFWIILTFGAHAQWDLVCVCVSRSFSQMQYQWLWRDTYKKEFCDRRFIQKLRHHLLIVTSYEGTAATFCTLFLTAEHSKGPPNNRLIRLNVRQWAAFSLVSVFLTKHCLYAYIQYVIRCVSITCALWRIYAHTYYRYTPRVRQFSAVHFWAALWHYFACNKGQKSFKLWYHLHILA